MIKRSGSHNYADFPQPCRKQFFWIESRQKSKSERWREPTITAAAPAARNRSWHVYSVLQLLDLTSRVGRGPIFFRGLSWEIVQSLQGGDSSQEAFSLKPRAMCGPGSEERTLSTTGTKPEGAPQHYAPGEAGQGEQNVWHTAFRLWRP